MQVDENSFTAINQSYKIWKKYVPFLYNVLQSYQLPSPSQSVEWFTQQLIQNDWKFSTLLLGSNSTTQNSLSLIKIALPTDNAITDYLEYKQECPQNTPQTNGYIGTMGGQNLQTKLTIPQSSEIMKARINKFDQNIIGIKTGGASPQFIIYNLKQSIQNLQQNAIKLHGHKEQGFGLAWSPHQNNRILSGSYDCLINCYDINSRGSQMFSIQASAGVEDVKWNCFNSNIFVSAQQDQKINLWDIRNHQKKSAITRKAHNGEIYSVDFNKYNQFWLLSGGQDGDICFWDTRNMSKKLNTFVGHNDSVNNVTWNPSKNLQFASGSSDRKIVIWDIEKTSLNTAQKSGNEIIFIHGGHRSKVTDLSWNKQNKAIASCQQNIVAQVWKMNDKI